MSSSSVLERLPAELAAKAGRSKRYSRQRVYILPTIQGLIYAVMLAVMLLGAMSYKNSMAFMLCFLLSGLGLVCMLHTYRNLVGLILNSKAPKPVFAGQQARFPVEVDNQYGPARFALTFTGVKRPRDFFLKKSIGLNSSSASIEAGKLNTVHYHIEANNRGLLKPDCIVISSQFPLGMFKAWSYFYPVHYCDVYPAAKGKKTFPMTIIENENANDGKQTGLDDFDGFRKYRPGDPVNTIAWKAYAREQGLLVKQFSGKGEKILIFAWDQVAHITALESKLSQLCYWIVLADKAGLYYGLRLPGFSTNPANGIHHKNSCLKVLAHYGE